MNHKSWLFLLAFLLIKIGCGENDVAISDAEVKDHELSNEEEKPNKEPFIATNEWQIIKPGQAIPAGLHVRMNFQTGIKEAKLMENESPSLKVTLNNQEGASNQKIYFTKDELKKKMKDFQDKIGTEDIVHDAHWSEEAKQHEREIRSKFRSMKEIQKDLEDSMGWKMKSDLDVMKTSLSLLEGKTLSIKEKAALLDNIEYYVHQIDNARDLEKIGGLRKIVLMLNHSSSELLQERSANVIGAAAQSNGVVQDAVREHGGVDLLVKLLHTQRSPATWKKALFALSAVVRGNHANQQRMIQLGGLATLMEFVSARQNIKALTLLYDLIVEQNEVGPTSRSPFLDSLVHHGWCDVIVPLLQSDDLDRQEKTMQAIDVSVPACRASWQHHPHAIEVMDSAWQHLQDLIHEEEDADHKSYLSELVQTMAAISRRVNKH